jgi:protein TonB
MATVGDHWAVEVDRDGKHRAGTLPQNTLASRIEPEPLDNDGAADISPIRPPAPAASPADVDIGAARAPRFVRREMPRYPPLARRLAKEGKVLLRLNIDEYGRLLRVEVLEPADYGFTEAALEAVHSSTYAPAEHEGKPVASRALLHVRFTLRRPE